MVAACRAASQQRAPCDAPSARASPLRRRARARRDTPLCSTLNHPAAGQTPRDHGVNVLPPHLLEFLLQCLIMPCLQSQTVGEARLGALGIRHGGSWRGQPAAQWLTVHAYRLVLCPSRDLMYRGNRRICGLRSRRRAGRGSPQHAGGSANWPPPRLAPAQGAESVVTSLAMRGPRHLLFAAAAKQPRAAGPPHRPARRRHTR